MTRSIAVGFDGSPDATRALRVALALARDAGAATWVLHARGLLEERAGPSAAPEVVSETVTELGLDPASVHWRVEDGDPCSVLLRSVGPPVDAEILVVGRRGHGRHEGLLLGSTSLELVEHARVPVVVVPTPSSG